MKRRIMILPLLCLLVCLLALTPAAMAEEPYVRAWTDLEDTTVRMMPDEALTLSVYYEASAPDGEDGELSVQWRMMPESSSKWTTVSDTVASGGVAAYTVETLEETTTFRCDVFDLDGNRARVSFTVLPPPERLTVTARTAQYVYLNPGSSADLEVGISGGTEPFETVWSDEAGETVGTDLSLTLTAAGHQTGISHPYTCTVTDAAGLTGSATFYVYVNDNSFSAWSNDQYPQVSGLGADFTMRVDQAAALDMSHITYQWWVCPYNTETGDYAEGERINGANGDSYTVENYRTPARYYCVVEDGYGTESRISFYPYAQVNLPVSVGQNSFTAELGTTVTLAVDTGEVSEELLPYLIYRWYDATGGDSQRIGGNTSAVDIGPVQAYGEYEVSVSSAFNDSMSYSFRYEIHPDTGLTAYAAGTDRETWGSLSVPAGEAGVLTVTAESATGRALSYTWSGSRDKLTEDGAYDYTETLDLTTTIGNTLTLEQVDTSYQICCEVSDGADRAWVHFNVNVDTGLYAYVGGTHKQYVNMEMLQGGSATLAVEAGAVEGVRLRYLWHVDGANSEGADGASLTLENVQEYTYARCEVSDGYGNSRTVWFYIQPREDFRAQATEELRAGETLWVGCNGDDERHYYVMHPGEDGFYKIYWDSDLSTGWHNPLLTVYDADQVNLVSGYGSVSFSLSAGETYYLSTSCYTAESSDSYPIHFIRDTEREALLEALATARPIAQGEVSQVSIREAGETVCFSFTASEAQQYCVTLNADAETKMSVYSADGELRNVYYGTYTNWMDWWDEGEAVYIAVSMAYNEAVTATLQIRSQEEVNREQMAAMAGAPVLELGVDTPVTIEDRGDMAYFQFVPETTDDYILSSRSATGYLYTCVTVYDAQGEEIARDDGLRDDGGVRVSVEMTAGQTYYFVARHGNWEACAFTVRLLSRMQEIEEFRAAVSTAIDLNLGQVASGSGSAGTMAYFSFTPDADGEYSFVSPYYQNRVSFTCRLFNDEGSELYAENWYSGNDPISEEIYSLTAGESYYYGVSAAAYGNDGDYGNDGTVSAVDFTVPVMVTSHEERFRQLQQDSTELTVSQTLTADIETIGNLSFTADQDDTYSILLSFPSGIYPRVYLYDGDGNFLDWKGYSSYNGNLVFSAEMSAGERLYARLECLSSIGEVKVSLEKSSSVRSMLQNAVELRNGETVTVPADATTFYKLSWEEAYKTYHFFTTKTSEAASVRIYSPDGTPTASYGFDYGDSGTSFSYLHWYNWQAEAGSTMYYAVSYRNCTDGAMEMTVLDSEAIEELFEVVSSTGEMMYTVPKGETVTLNAKVLPQWLTSVGWYSEWSSYSNRMENGELNRTYHTPLKWNDNSYNPFAVLTDPVTENRVYEFNVTLYIPGYQFESTTRTLRFYVSCERESGYAGDNITWALSSDGSVLTLSGSGEMWDYFEEGGFPSPWAASAAGITQVNVGEGITRIGTDAFRNLSSLTEISLPAGITSIGRESFAGCTALTSVTFLGAAPDISKSAFSAVTADVWYPRRGGGWSTSDFSAYGGRLTWKALESKETPDLSTMDTLTLPTGLSTIEAEAFAGGAFEAVVIPNGCKTIGSRAFADCEKLIYVRIPSSVAEIAADAFEGCNIIWFEG